MSQPTIETQHGGVRLDSVERAIADIAAGKAVVVDHEERARVRVGREGVRHLPEVRVGERVGQCIAERGHHLPRNRGDRAGLSPERTGALPDM